MSNEILLKMFKLMYELLLQLKKLFLDADIYEKSIKEKVWF